MGYERVYTEDDYNTGELNILKHERRIIVKSLILEQAITKASKRLGISLRHLNRKILAHQIKLSEWKVRCGGKGVSAKNIRIYTDKDYSRGEYNLKRHERNLMIKTLKRTQSVEKAAVILKIPLSLMDIKIKVHTIKEGEWKVENPKTNT